jgi:hypothetical protein
MRQFIITVRLLLLSASVSTLALPVWAHPDGGHAGDGDTVAEIIIAGRRTSLLGRSDSATEGTIGREELGRRPLLRPGEVLEAVPGIIITQHAGGGKANQYFLRGFNLDHGTDFSTSLDGMPINLPTHGHGQGYADLNPVIPEFVDRIDYQKGSYAAADGDFSAAGSASIHTVGTLARPLARLEVGEFGQRRAVLGGSLPLIEGDLLAGAELVRNDGPWERPDSFRKLNGLLRFSRGDEAGGYSLTARLYDADWNSSDQVPASAVESGQIRRFGNLDDTTGGESRRISLQGRWFQADDQTRTSVDFYGFYYDFNLFSNFTLFLTDPVAGDQFEQADSRYVGGLHARHDRQGTIAGLPMSNTAGLQLRHDRIRNGLFNTSRRQRVDKQAEDGMLIPAVTRRDRVLQTSTALYLENRINWTDSFRTVAGLRGDLFTFDVASDRAENSGERSALLASPKLSLIFGPWAGAEFYLQGGLGYHSNDARGVLSRVDPISGSAGTVDGQSIMPADPLVRSKAADAGIRFVPFNGLQSTLSLFVLDLDSELVFVGDAGTTEAGRPSRRHGLELANFYTVTDWLTLDADLSLSRSRFRDQAAEGDHIPGSVESVLALGVSVHDLGGPFGSLRLRYFGPRPLIEDNTVRSNETILVNLQAGWQISKDLTVALDVFNLLDRTDHDIDYFYESRTTPGAEPVSEIHYHPVEPRQFRLSVTGRF